MPGSGGKLHEVGPDFGVGGARRLLEHALTALLMDCMLTAHAALWRQYLKLHDLVDPARDARPSVRLCHVAVPRARMCRRLRNC